MLRFHGDIECGFPISSLTLLLASSVPLSTQTSRTFQLILHPLPTIGHHDERRGEPETGQHRSSVVRSRD